MQIKHRMTFVINKGRISVFEMETKENEKTFFTVMPSKITKCVTENSIEKIEAAINRERIIERYDFLTKDIISEIEEPIVNWLCQEKSEDIITIRWEDDQMKRFKTRGEASAYDVERENQFKDEKTKNQKQRIMMG